MIKKTQTVFLTSRAVDELRKRLNRTFIRAANEHHSTVVRLTAATAVDVVLCAALFHYDRILRQRNNIDCERHKGSNKANQSLTLQPNRSRLCTRALNARLASVLTVVLFVIDV